MNIIRHAPNNAWIFLRTEMKPETKPLLLSVADKILYSWTYTKITADGFPVKKERQIKGLTSKEESITFAKQIDFISSGIGLLAACAYTGSFLKTFTFPALLVYTASSFASKLFLVNSSSLDAMTPLLKIISLIAFTALIITGVIFASSYFLIIPVQMIFALDGVSRFIYLNNVVKCLAFNFFAGALLKFIAYKIYPHVQNAYDNFFQLLKAGEIDPRAGGDKVLCNEFANQLTPTIFNEIPPEIFEKITQFFHSQDAFKFRLLSKASFCLISNPDCLGIKIDNNFFFSPELSLKDTKKIKNKLLKIFETYPLDSRLMPQVINNGLAVQPYKSDLDYLMQNSEKMYWIKSSSHQKTLIGQKYKKSGDMAFTFKISYAISAFPAFK